MPFSGSVLPAGLSAGLLPRPLGDAGNTFVLSPQCCRHSLPPCSTLWLPGDLKGIFPCPRGRSWVLISHPCGTLLNSWPFLVAQVSGVCGAVHFFHLFLQNLESMWWVFLARCSFHACLGFQETGFDLQGALAFSVLTHSPNYSVH